MSKENKTIVLVREPNVNVPEAYLRKVLAACPSGGGYSVQSKNARGEPELITDNTDSGGDLEGVQELLKGYSSHRILLAFNKLEKVDEKFLQPFHVALDGDDVLLSFGIDGTFPTMVEAGTTEESLLAQRVMFPNIQKLIKYSAGDLDKFLAELRDPTFVDMVMSRIGDRGAFCFLPPTGEAIWLGKNTIGSTFPWGQTSDTLGYTETPASAQATKADVKKGWWGKSKGPEVPVAQADLSPAVEPAAPPPVPDPVNNPAPAQPDTRIVAPPAEPPKGKWVAIPKGLSKDQRKKMIRRVTNCGSVLPDKWNEDPFYYFEAEYARDEQLAALAAQNGPKDMRNNQPAPSSGHEVRELREETAIFMMSKDELSETEEAILKIMDRQGKEVPNPLEAQKREAKYPKFSDKFGLKIEQTHTWDARDLKLLSPKALFHYALELRRRDIERTATVAPPKSVETTAPASSTPAAQKGFWGKKTA
jgi:hypothetical protein